MGVGQGKNCYPRSEDLPRMLQVLSLEDLPRMLQVLRSEDLPRMLQVLRSEYLSMILQIFSSDDEQHQHITIHRK